MILISADLTPLISINSSLSMHTYKSEQWNFIVKIVAWYYNNYYMFASQTITRKSERNQGPTLEEIQLKYSLYNNVVT